MQRWYEYMVYKYFPLQIDDYDNGVFIQAPYIDKIMDIKLLPANAVHYIKKGKCDKECTIYWYIYSMLYTHSPKGNRFSAI